MSDHFDLITPTGGRVRASAERYSAGSADAVSSAPEGAFLGGVAVET
jgi:hypothetical protein